MLMRMLIISWRLLSVLIPVMLSGPADPEFDADADAVPDHPNIRSDGSLHRDPESRVCVCGWSWRCCVLHCHGFRALQVWSCG